MPSAMSTYLGNKVLRWLAGNTFPAAPSSVYVGLFDGDPKGAGTEITTDVRSAGRVAITWDAIADGTDNINQNGAVVDFGASETGAIDVSHVGIFDAASSGNLLWANTVTGGPFTIDLGSPVKFPVGDLLFTVGT